MSATTPTAGSFPSPQRGGGEDAQLESASGTHPEALSPRAVPRVETPLGQLMRQHQFSIPAAGDAAADGSAPAGVAARTITSMAQLVGIGITTLAGWLVDRYGLIRINVVGTVAMLATGLPAIAIGLNGSPMTLLLALSLATPALMVILGSQGLLGVAIAPTMQRCGVFSIAYSTSVALFGGTAPLIATWMVEQSVPSGLIMLYPVPFVLATGWALWRSRHLTTGAL